MQSLKIICTLILFIIQFMQVNANSSAIKVSDEQVLLMRSKLKQLKVFHSKQAFEVISNPSEARVDNITIATTKKRSTSITLINFEEAIKQHFLKNIDALHNKDPKKRKHNINQNKLAKLLRNTLKDLEIKKVKAKITYKEGKYFIELMYPRIDKIYVRGNQYIMSPLVRELLKTAFNIKNLNKDELYKLSYLLKTLPGLNKAKIDFYNIDKNGNMAMNVNLVDDKRYTITAGIRNDLNKSMGYWRSKVSVSKANLLLNHDNLTVFGFMGGFDKDVLFAGFDYNLRINEHGTTIGTQITNANIRPEISTTNHDIDTEQYAIYLRHPLIMDRKSRLSVTSKLVYHKNTGTFFNNKVSQKTKRTDLEIQLDYMRADEYKGKTDIRITFKKGLNLGRNYTNRQLDNNLDAAALNIDISRIQNLTKDIKLIPALNYQKAHGSPGVIQSYSFGNGPNEHGYKKHSVSGQSGYKASLKITYIDALYAYYAHGKIKDKSLSGTQKHKNHLSNVGMGINVPISKNIVINAEYAVPLTKITNNSVYHKRTVFIGIGGKWKL